MSPFLPHVSLRLDRSRRPLAADPYKQVRRRLLRYILENQRRREEFQRRGLSPQLAPLLEAKLVGPHGARLPNGPQLLVDA